jgi:tRNA (cmo5U34)-methyltransferase
MDIPVDWTFKNSSVAQNFDQHVREQLPWYDLATGAIAHIARHYIQEGGLIYDIGASTGNIGIALSETIKARKARFIPIEVSEEMAALYHGPGNLVITDATTFEYENFDVAVLFLCLMFIPIAARKALMKDLTAKLNPGGAIIFFEKMLPPVGYIGTALHRLTIAGKVATGSKADDIIKKELSLTGAQRPLSEWFIECLSPHPVRVFQFGEFVGYVIERPE